LEDNKMRSMKKILLSLVLAGGACFANAQTFVQVLYPSNIAGGFDHTFADWALTPDMTDPANRVIAPVMIARDNSAGDSLLCNPTTQDLTGKIALVFRGECEFGDKAVNAWNAGAVGVVIVGHTAGELITMSSGTNAQGDVIDIPATFIKKEDGEIVYNALMAGDSVSMLLGNKNAYFVNDLGSTPGYTANVPAQAPVQLAESTTDFPIVYAAQIYNYGSANQSNVKVIVDLKKNGSVIHTDTSNVITLLNAGDSTDQFTFTNYDGALGVGDYTIEYAIVSDSVDDTPTDNKFIYPFRINNDKLFSYAKYNADSSFTFNSGNYGPAERNGDFQSCIMFKHAKGNQVGIKGLWFNASIGDDLTIDGEEILFQVFKWNDAFVYGTDSPSFNLLADVTAGSYIYEEDKQNEFVYAHMDDYVLLESNARYLVCAKIYNEKVYIGYDNETKYNYYSSIIEQYISPIADGSTWYASGFVGGPVPSLTLHFFTTEEVGLTNADKLVKATLYPNPAKDVVNVLVDNYEGTAKLTVTDLAGKTVIANDVTIASNGNVSFNTAGLNAGMYIVKMQLANGNEVKASVVVE